MIGGHHVVAIIPARGGSKSVPNKNIRPLGDKPLLVWSIEVAHAAELIDAVVVTTDSDAIAKVAWDYGASVIPRPTHLATDDALVIDAIRHAVRVWRGEGKSIDVMVLLEPTCPFRSVEDVEACLMRLERDASLDSVATFTDAALNPHRAWRLEGDRPEPFIEGAVPWRPRQALPDAYQLNGGVYAFWADLLPEDAIAPLFGQAGAVYMPAERSVDIDTELDLKLANLMVSDDMLRRAQ
jgi:N-acylneuraminate cytidylyltransferase